MTPEERRQEETMAAKWGGNEAVILCLEAGLPVIEERYGHDSAEAHAIREELRSTDDDDARYIERARTLEAILGTVGDIRIGDEDIGLSDLDLMTDKEYIETVKEAVAQRLNKDRSKAS